MMHSALRVSVLITPHTSCMLHIFAIISSIIKTRTARVMAIPLIVVMIEARMRRIRLQGTPLPPPAVPRIQVQVITVVAVGVNMSACGKSCFICTMLYGQGSNAFKHFYFGTLYLLFVLPVRTISSNQRSSHEEDKCDYIWDTVC